MYRSWPFFLIKPSNIQYSSGFIFVNFVIDWMSKNYMRQILSRKVLVKHRYVQHLPAPELIPCFLWCPCSSFSFPCVFFICLSLYYIITQCCLCLWIAHSRLPLMFTYTYTFNVIPNNYVGHTFLWLIYTFVQIILNYTYR